ncbi:MAG: DUF4190 domain-containing protein [Verrucomicrobiales bacterium]|nr:DUF4190 domain-containing protein [Verrucomicrobiales bacterium]
MDQSLPPQGQPVPGKNSGFALTSMILGIVSLPGICCHILGLPLAIAAVVFGHVGMNDLKKNPEKGGAGMAKAGLIMGYIAIPLMIGFFIFAIMMGDPENQMNILEMLEQMEAGENGEIEINEETTLPESGN